MGVTLPRYETRSFTTLSVSCKVFVMFELDSTNPSDAGPVKGP